MSGVPRRVPPGPPLLVPKHTLLKTSVDPERRGRTDLRSSERNGTTVVRQRPREVSGSLGSRVPRGFKIERFFHSPPETPVGPTIRVETTNDRGTGTIPMK